MQTLTDCFIELPPPGEVCPHIRLTREEIEALGVGVYDTEDSRSLVWWYEVRKAILDRMDRPATPECSNGSHDPSYRAPAAFRVILASFESCHLSDIPPEARPYAGPYYAGELDSLGAVVADLTHRYGAEGVLLAHTRKAVRVFVVPSKAEAGRAVA